MDLARNLPRPICTRPPLCQSLIESSCLGLATSYNLWLLFILWSGLVLTTLHLVALNLRDPYKPKNLRLEPSLFLELDFKSSVTHHWPARKPGNILYV
jgi:hypothetical protein